MPAWPTHVHDRQVKCVCAQTHTHTHTQVLEMHLYVATRSKHDGKMKTKDQHYRQKTYVYKYHEDKGRNAQPLVLCVCERKMDCGRWQVSWINVSTEDCPFFVCECGGGVYFKAPPAGGGLVAIKISDRDALRLLLTPINLHLFDLLSTLK